MSKSKVDAEAVYVRCEGTKSGWASRHAADEWDEYQANARVFTRVLTAVADGAGTTELVRLLGVTDYLGATTRYVEEALAAAEDVDTRARRVMRLRLYPDALTRLVRAEQERLAAIPSWTATVATPGGKVHRGNPDGEGYTVVCSTRVGAYVPTDEPVTCTRCAKYETNTNTERRAA
jgi:hypothetical protein